MAADLVIQELAAFEAALILEARELAADRQAYRELAHEALHKLADLTRQHARTTAQNRHLRDELARYTASATLGRVA